MATTCTTQNTSNRGMAMLLSLASAVVLSPLYLTRKDHHRTTHFYDTNITTTGFLLPVLLAGLIIAIKTTSSSFSSSSSSSSSSRFSSSTDNENDSFFPTPEPSWVLRIGSSSWGLAGILLMLMLVLSCQNSVQHFFMR